MAGIRFAGGSSAASTGASSVDLFGETDRERGRAAPTLERVSASIITGTAALQQSVYFISPMYVVDKLASPIDAYYAWISTDHDNQYGGGGGIWLYTAPSAAGPWTRGSKVFEDTVHTGETETPSVMYVADDPNSRPFYCFYQEVHSVADTGQITRLATSADGVTWVREDSGKLRQVGATSENMLYMFLGTGDDAPTGSHTGYFSPFRVGEMYYAYALYGGGDAAAYGLWASTDCRVWLQDRRLLRYNAHLVGAPGDWKRVNFTSGSHIVFNGRPWILGSVSPFTSGAGAAVRDLVAIQTAWDLRTVIGKPRLLLTLDQAGESQDIRSVRAFTDHKGVMYVYYQCGQSINLAKVVNA